MKSVLVGALLYTYQSEIKQLLSYTYKYIVECTESKIIVFTLGNEKLSYAIRSELSTLTNSKTYVATDGFTNPNYKIANGSYKIFYRDTSIYIDISDTQIEIYSYFTTVNKLKTFINDTYAKYSTTENVLVFYLLDKQSWNYPIFRRPRKINVITPEMEKFLADVAEFNSIQTEQSYETNGIPYRRGYLIEGEPGTGKSAIVEKVAMIYNMTIYTAILNSEKMTDAVLINLVSTVPPKSLILFDEMDKQYESIKSNPTVNLSISGILSALDGAQRLSFGTIVIIIVNNINKFEDKFKIPLLRKGRIDSVFKFETVFLK